VCRFNELRKKHKRFKATGIERPFSRMYNFFTLEHGEKWGKTGSRFKPVSAAGYPSHPDPPSTHNAKANAAKKEDKVTEGKKEERIHASLPAQRAQVLTSQVLKSDSMAHSSKAGAPLMPRGRQRDPSITPPLPAPPRRDNLGQFASQAQNLAEAHLSESRASASHSQTARSRIVDAGEMIERQLQALVDRVRSFNLGLTSNLGGLSLISKQTEAASVLLRGRNGPTAAYLTAILEKDPDTEDCDVKLKHLERMGSTMRAAINDLSRLLYEGGIGNTQGPMYIGSNQAPTQQPCMGPLYCSPNAGVQGGAAMKPPQIDLCHLRATKSGTCRRRQCSDWSWGAREESSFATPIATPKSSGATQGISSFSTPFSLAATATSAPAADLAAAAGPVKAAGGGRGGEGGGGGRGGEGGGDTGCDEQVYNSSPTTLWKKKEEVRTRTFPSQLQTAALKDTVTSTLAGGSEAGTADGAGAGARFNKQSGVQSAIMSAGKQPENSPGATPSFALSSLAGADDAPRQSAKAMIGKSSKKERAVYWYSETEGFQRLLVPNVTRKNANTGMRSVSAKIVTCKGGGGGGEMRSEVLHKEDKELQAARTLCALQHVPAPRIAALINANQAACTLCALQHVPAPRNAALINTNTNNNAAKPLIDTNAALINTSTNAAKAFIYTFGTTCVNYSGIRSCESAPLLAAQHAKKPGVRIRHACVTKSQERSLSVAPNPQLVEAHSQMYSIH
jgi:hypothetical protein